MESELKIIEMIKQQGIIIGSNIESMQTLLETIEGLRLRVIALENKDHDI